MKLKNEEKMTWKRKLVRHTLAEVQKRRSTSSNHSLNLSSWIIFSGRIGLPLLYPILEKAPTMPKAQPRLSKQGLQSGNKGSQEQKK